MIKTISPLMAMIPTMFDLRRHAVAFDTYFLAVELSTCVRSGRLQSLQMITSTSMPQYTNCTLRVPRKCRHSSWSFLRVAVIPVTLVFVVDVGAIMLAILMD